MGCVTKKPINTYNFISAQVMNDVLITDLGDPIGECLLLLSPPFVMGAVVDSDEVQLSWASGVGGFEYDIYQSLSEFSGFSVIDTIPGTSKLVTGLETSTTYFFKVKYVGFGTESIFSNTVSVTTDMLEAPTGLSVSSTIYNKVIAIWTSNSDGSEDGFSLERSLTAVGGFTEVETTTTGVVTVTDEGNGLKGLTEYFYRVKATDVVGDSAYSNVDNLTTGTSLLNLANPNGDQLTNPNGDKLVALN